MRRNRLAGLTAAAVACAMLSPAMFRPSTAAAAPRPTGAQLKQASVGPSLSADGTKVAFVSRSADLVKGDTNAGTDVFVKDLETGAVVRASAAADGAGGNDDSTDPSLSADGTKVAFVSTATNLVVGDTNGGRDVFVKDLRTGAVVRVSTRTGGGQVPLGGKEPSLSADGSRVAFVSFAPDLVDLDTNNQSDVFVKTLATDTTVRASTGDQAGGVVLSADGIHVAFWQYAPSAHVRDVYVKDLRTGAAVVASLRADGGKADDESSEPSLSADGSRVAFTSFATNLVPGDGNGAGDVFVKDLATGAVILASIRPKGRPGDFTSELPALSADGTRVAFMSFASNLVAGDTNHVEDVFVKTLATGTIVRASTAAKGVQVDLASYEPSLSAKGTRVAFSSAAAGLVRGDTNGVRDVFVKTLKSGAVLRASTRPPAPKAR
jgi:Tol biopolymer transport system component